MKTIVIWDNGECDLKFFTVDKDISHLHGVYVNGGNEEKLEDELMALTWNEEDQEAVPMLDTFPIEVAGQQDTKVIVAGFLP